MNECIDEVMIEGMNISLNNWYIALDRSLVRVRQVDSFIILNTFVNVQRKYCDSRQNTFFLLYRVSN